MWHGSVLIWHMLGFSLEVTSMIILGWLVYFLFSIFLISVLELETKLHLRLSCCLQLGCLLCSSRVVVRWLNFLFNQQKETTSMVGF